jgi:hypothetical protein
MPAGYAGLTSATRSARPTAGRDSRLDAVRGLLLVLMTLTHVPSGLSHRFNGPFGIVSSAEGFVLLAACLCGFVYGRSLERDGLAVMRGKVWHRARRVYFAHLLVLLPVAVIALLLSSWSTNLANHFGPLRADPLAGFLLMPLLLHSPPLFDVLPMYVVGLLLTPQLLARGRQRGWLPLLGLAGLLWLLAQFGLGFRTRTFFPEVLAIHPGHFDWFAWGALWIAGLALGSAAREGRVAPGPRGRPLPGLLPAALLVVAIGFLLRHGLWPQAWFHPDLWLYTSKWTLGPFRAANLISLVYVIWRWNPHPPVWLVEPLALLGRHSLVVFSVHLPFAVAGHVLVEGLPPDELDPTGSLYALACVLLLFLVALRLEARRKRDRREFPPAHGKENQGPGAVTI